MNSFIHNLVEHPFVLLFLSMNLLVAGWVYKKTSIGTFYDYALASRSLSIGVLVISLLATRVGSGDLEEPGRVFDEGLIQALISVIFILSLLWVGLFIAPRFLYYSDCLTLGDLMGKFFNPLVQVLTGIVSSIFSILIISTQIEAIGNISYHILDISPRNAILFFSLFTIIYSLFGGVRSVSYTDILQGIACFMVIGYLTHTLLQVVGEKVLWRSVFTERSSFLSHPNLYDHLKNVAFWNYMPVFVLTPPIVQRMLMVRDKHKVKEMWCMVSVFYGLVLFLLTMVGLIAFVGKEQLGIKDSTDLLPHLISHLFEGRKWLKEILFTGLLGILLSTMDSYLHAVGISLVQDVVSPFYRYFLKKELGEKRKMAYAKGGILLVGLISMGVGFFGSAQLENEKIHAYSVIIFSVILFPFIVNILGFRSKVASLAFVFSYVGGLVWLFLWGWSLFDSFLVSMSVGIVTYFVFYLFYNTPLKVIKGRYCKQEKNVPEGSFFSRLSDLAKTQLINYPNAPLRFSLLVFILYAFSSTFPLVKEGAIKGVDFMQCIYGIALLLCCGLLLQEVWPSKILTYFPLYWFFTLFFCLPICWTLMSFSLLKSWGLTHLMCGLILFACLTGGYYPCFIGFTGSLIACGIWYMVYGELPNSFWNYDMSVGAILSLVVLLAGVFFTVRREGLLLRKKLVLSKLMSNDFSYEIRDVLHTCSAMGFAFKNVVKEVIPMPNKNKSGYWIPEERYDFLSNFSDMMMNKSEEVSEELERFTQFIEQQAFGISTEEQEEISALKLTKKALKKLSNQYLSKMKISVTSNGNLSGKELITVFPTILTNLVRNSCLYGKASHISIEIDESKRTIQVRDDGEGIPPELYPHIFDLYYTSNRGNGIGLAFVKMLVQATGWNIYCDTKYGGEDSFTKFTIQL